MMVMRKRLFELLARGLVLAALIVMPAGALALRSSAQMDDPQKNGPGKTVELRGRMPENGGWSHEHITVEAGQPLHLRLFSDDVVHSFAVGKTNWPVVDMYPGERAETTLVFDEPGVYAFYCTRWCGPNHWRMRGVIEVTGSNKARPPASPPLYERLGIDIDAPHPAEVLPEAAPSAVRGESFLEELPQAYLTSSIYREQSPARVWQALRAEPGLADLADMDLWDLTAAVWQANITREIFERGRDLYSNDCAACHGETGMGDGVYALQIAPEHPELGSGEHEGLKSPVDFTDAGQLLGASPALLQGKVIRGGMGTGMPYWGPIYTEEDTWAVTAYLWSFQFEMEYEHEQIQD
jgi:mono/diheme cytochrome c family protein/plastocyanin